MGGGGPMGRGCVDGGDMWNIGCTWLLGGGVWRQGCVWGEVVLSLVEAVFSGFRADFVRIFRLCSNAIQAVGVGWRWCGGIDMFWACKFRIIIRRRWRIVDIVHLQWLPMWLGQVWWRCVAVRWGGLRVDVGANGGVPGTIHANSGAQPNHLCGTQQ